MGRRVYLDGDHIVFDVSFHENHLAKACGSRWHPTSKKWRTKASRLTANAVQGKFPLNEIDPAIIALAGVKKEIPPLTIDPDALLRDIKLRPRQRQGIEKAWPNPNFALFWVMGAGKTLSSIAIANLRRTYDMIDRLLIICPTSIKGVWKKEFDRYSGLPHDMFVMEAGGKVPKFNDFPIMVVGVEAMSQGGAYEEAGRFVAGGRTLTIIDESSTIKNHDAARTERCWDLGSASEQRLILTGTNVTQGLQDLFAQMYFVDPSIIGELSYYSFRNNYCIMGGFENRKIIGYRDPQSLLDKIRPYCDVVRKADLKDLPPKQYQVREVRATPAQHKACKELAREMKTKLGDKDLTVQNALEALLRFQQIAGGYDHEGQPLGSNPKMTELVALLEEYDGKAIIWARYLHEIAGITTELDKRWPGSTLSLYGAVAPESRQALVDDFQSNPERRFFVTNQATGGKGITLTAATLSVYYSNTFSLEDRSQSEDRNHRIGQFNAVTYVDLMSDLKVDRHIITALTQKKEVAEYAAAGLRVDDML
jgi:SNF2 family DNA or RNA helicase